MNIIYNIDMDNKILLKSYIGKSDKYSIIMNILDLIKQKLKTGTYQEVKELNDILKSFQDISSETNIENNYKSLLNLLILLNSNNLEI